MRDGESLYLRHLRRIVALLVGIAASAISASASGQLRVALIGGAFYDSGAEEYLDSLGDIDAARIDECSRAALGLYDVVVVHGAQTCWDSAALDAFADGGGGVVITPFTVGMRSALGDIPDCFPVAAGASFASTCGDTDLSVTNPDDPLLDSVAFVAGDQTAHERFDDLEELRLGAESSADWPDARFALATWVYGSGRVAYVNLNYVTLDPCPLASDYPWGQRLLENAVRYAANDLGGDADSDTDTDSDGDADMDSDSDVDTDTETDTGSDTETVPCTENTDCPSGAACYDGQCGRIHCEHDEECGPGRACFDGVCAEVCETTADCENGQICDSPAHYCRDRTHSQGGCGCGVSDPSPGGLRWLATPLTILAVSLRRRHRHRRSVAPSLHRR